MEAHGDRIWAESDGPGLGARFTFTIPTVEQAGYVTPAASTPPPARPSRRRAEEQVRVLAVDDDPEALRFIRDALVKSGYTSIVTADPEEALRLVEEERPHLMMLGADGMELMQEIAAADVPVVFLSVYGRDDVVAQALEEGDADYIVKPFSSTELVARVQAALRRSKDPSQQEGRNPSCWASWPSTTGGGG